MPQDKTYPQTIFIFLHIDLKDLLAKNAHMNGRKFASNLFYLFMFLLPPQLCTLVDNSSYKTALFLRQDINSKCNSYFPSKFIKHFNETIVGQKYSLALIIHHTVCLSVTTQPSPPA